MSLLLDHPFFDAVGLGTDAKKVGVGCAKEEHTKVFDHPLSYAERTAIDPYADDESRYVHSAELAASAHNAPVLLEYHHPGEDEELNFIPKTVAGFALGTMALGFCLNLATLLIFSHDMRVVTASMFVRFVFAVGIGGVACSLLLVGLKFRADHSSEILHSRHWLNSIGTGALFALLTWGPWLATEHNFFINRFLMEGIWMLLFFFPAIAARWTVGPAKHYGI